MNFFCTKKDYDEWVEKMNIDRSEIYCLNIFEALSVAKMLFNVTDI